MKKVPLLMVLLTAAAGLVTTATVGSAATTGRVFEVRRVTLPGLCAATWLDCVEDQLAIQVGTTTTREVINMNDMAIFANHQRFAYDALPDPTQPNLFALEITGRIVVGSQDLTTTFAVGSDDGFLLEVEGGSFVKSAETLPACCAGSVTTTADNQLLYNGLRAYAESYGVFEFDKPGVYAVRLLYIQALGEAIVNFFSARGDQLQGLASPIFPPDPFPEGAFSLVNDPSGANGVRLLPPTAGKKK